MKVCLICPTPEEGRILSRSLKMVEKGPFFIYRGKIKKGYVSLIISGIGKTNAASAATYMINKYRPQILILFGIGGAYPLTGLSIGDVAVAEREFYGDEGVITRKGFQGTELIGIPLLKKGRKRFFNEFSLNERLVRIVKGAIKGPFKSGNFVTLSSTTGTVERAVELRDRYSAICENMEGASVAHVCKAFGRDLIEIRGISNIVEDRDPSRWDIEKGIRSCSDALFDILDLLS